MLLRAAAQKNKGDIYARDLARLTTRNAATAADHAAYWSLLASNGRTSEAVKLAVADRIRWAGDPKFSPVPLDRLLSDSYIAARRKLIEVRR